MKTLYIIGNGFDMHHGLKSSYYSFGQFLKKKNSGQYWNLVDHFGFPYIQDGIDQDEEAKLKIEWNELEERLADLDFDGILDEHSDYLANPASSEFTDGDWDTYAVLIKNQVDEFTKGMSQVFKQFILELEFPDDINGREIFLDYNAVFLNFNYTDTLEKYYGVSPAHVLYIHQKAKSSERLILGHSHTDNPMKEEPAKMPDGLDEEDQQRWWDEQSDNYDLSYQQGRAALEEYFKQSFKPTAAIINEKHAFFESLHDIESVMVLGHSLAEVDHPYFHKIIESIADKHIPWQISYYWDDELKEKRERLMSFGLAKQIRLFKMNELLI